ncbi:MAG: tetratricopeptide repeat protein [Flavobacteriales bacterium]|nr:tetratricopeptide repeat protein [Flavobacteriales bacterium]
MSRLETLQKMLFETPKDEFLLYAIALEYRKLDKLDDAIEILEGLLESHDDYLPVYYQLGHLYAEQGGREQAIDIFQKGIALAQTRGDRRTMGELSEALMLLED